MPPPFDEWLHERLRNGSVDSEVFARFDKDYAAAFGNIPVDKDRAMQMFVRNEYAASAFVQYIVVGGVVSMIAAGMLCMTIPSQTRAAPRTSCEPYGSDSLVAHLGETGLSYFVAPVVYSIGTGMLGATLFRDASQNEGIFETLKYFGRREGVAKMDVAAYTGKNAIAAGGVIFALVCMSAGTFDWNFVDPDNVEAGDAPPDSPLCRTLHKGAYDASAPNAQNPIGVAKLLTADGSLLTAVILNFLADSLMVGECFEHGKLSDSSQVIKILVDNTILVVALAMRARQQGADAGTLLAYLSAISGIYVLFVAIGYVIKKSSIDHGSLKAFCAGFVPVVLIWTLLLELAPNTMIFTDDAGFDIARGMRLSTGMSYTNRGGERVTLKASQCAWFNQREVVVSLVTMAAFYAYSANSKRVSTL